VVDELFVFFSPLYAVGRCTFYSLVCVLFSPIWFSTTYVCKLPVVFYGVSPSSYLTQTATQAQNRESEIPCSYVVAHTIYGPLQPNSSTDVRKPTKRLSALPFPSLSFTTMAINWRWGCQRSAANAGLRTYDLSS
jgi:hypothetical protein